MFRRSQHSSRRSVAARALRVTWRIALIAFHAVLLAGRLYDASILQPAVLARWGGALALILTAFLFQRFAPVRLRGRRAVIVFWLLAAFLHFFGPLEINGHQLDLELALGLAVPTLAFALLIAEVEHAAASVRGTLAHQSLSLYLSPAHFPTAPRGPPLQSV
jgi:hypothetical protein